MTRWKRFERERAFFLERYELRALLNGARHVPNGARHVPQIVTKLVDDDGLWVGFVEAHAGVDPGAVTDDLRGMATRIRVYIACSLDGFIAGPDDDLSWLPGANGVAPEGPTGDGALGYEAFMADVGAILMGRKTYGVARGFEGPWPYGDTPVLVVTHRPLEVDAPATVRAIDGDVGDVVAAARAAASGKDVYLDGGSLIRQALDAGLIDELVVTQVPVVLGAGASLFAGTTKRHAFDVVGHVDYLGMVQLTLRPQR